MNIAIDDQETGRVLFTKRCFDHFVIFLPINQLYVNRIPDKYIEEARKVAKQYDSRVYLPNSKEISRPISDQFRIIHEYLTSQFIICDNIDAANAICNNGEYSLKAVTVDGDVFEPGGNVSGGYIHQKETLFSKWMKFREIRKQFQKSNTTPKSDIVTQLNEKTKRLEDLKGQRSELSVKAQNLEKLRLKVKELRSNGMENNVVDITKKIELFKKKIEEGEQEIKIIEDNINSTKKFISNISKGGDVKSILKQKLDDLEIEIKDLQAQKKKHLISLSESESSLDKEKEDVSKYTENIREGESIIDQYKIKIEERSKFVQSLEIEISNHQVKVDNHRKTSRNSTIL